MEERARRFGEIVGGPWAGRSEAAGSGSSSFVSGRQTRRLITGQSGHGFRPIWNLPKTIATIVSNWLGATTTGRIDEGAPRPRGRGTRPGEVRVGGSPWSLGCTNPRMHTIFAFWRQPDMLEPLIRYVRLARTDEVERDVGRLASKKQSGTVLEPCLSSARWFSLSHSGLSAPHPPIVKPFVYPSTSPTSSSLHAHHQPLCHELAMWPAAVSQMDSMHWCRSTPIDAHSNCPIFGRRSIHLSFASLGRSLSRSISLSLSISRGLSLNLFGAGTSSLTGLADSGATDPRSLTDLTESAASSLKLVACGCQPDASQLL